MNIVKQWNGLCREVMWSPSLELFKFQLDKVLSSLVWSSRWPYFVKPPEVLSNLNYPTILFHLDNRDNRMHNFHILNSSLLFELLRLKQRVNRFFSVNVFSKRVTLLSFDEKSLRPKKRGLRWPDLRGISKMPYQSDVKASTITT